MNILILNDHAFTCEALGTVRRDLNSNGKVLELISNSPPSRRHQGFSAFSDLRGVAISVIVLSGREDTDVDNQTPGFATAGTDQSAAVFMDVGALKRELRGPTVNSANASVHGERIPQHVLSEVGLTDRQLDVLGLMLQGKSNKAICRDLNLAEPTVKNHVTAILRALKVTNRTEAVIAVRDMGWTPLPRPPKRLKMDLSGGGHESHKNVQQLAADSLHRFGPLSGTGGSNVQRPSTAKTIPKATTISAVSRIAS
jgi:DNA-binding CsgD family transcriptional regulator